MLTRLLSLFTQPDICVSGLLYGKLRYELSGTISLRCPESGWQAEVTFKRRSWTGGVGDGIEGFIKQGTGKKTYRISGTWSGAMYITEISTQEKTLLFDVREHTPVRVQTLPLADQAPNESQRVWSLLAQAILRKNFTAASEAKSEIETRQRLEAAERKNTNTLWEPRLFQQVCDASELPLRWVYSLDKHCSL